MDFLPPPEVMKEHMEEIQQEALKIKFDEANKWVPTVDNAHVTASVIINLKGWQTYAM